MKDDRLYLLHIQECIARIKQYSAGGKQDFLADPKTQDAVMRNLQLLAESTQRLSEGLRAGHPEVNWRGIAGFRNVLVHGYLGVNVVRVWEIVERDLPVIEKLVMAIMQEQGLPREEKR
jgi:uncharacterized protein with HEPN domain